MGTNTYTITGIPNGSQLGSTGCLMALMLQRDWSKRTRMRILDPIRLGIFEGRV